MKHRLIFAGLFVAFAAVSLAQGIVIGLGQVQWWFVSGTIAHIVIGHFAGRQLRIIEGHARNAGYREAMDDIAAAQEAHRRAKRKPRPRLYVVASGEEPN